MENVGNKEQLTEELKNDVVKSTTEISKPKSKTSMIMRLLYQVEDVPEIADKANCSESYVRVTASRKKIFTKDRVIKEIESGKSDEEIAKAGQVDVNAVQTVREEYIKQEKEQNKKTRTSIIIELLYQVEDVPEIADKANCSEAYVRTIASNKKIYIKSRVIKEIESGKSNEEIAQEGKVNVDAVQTVREEYNRKKQEEQAREKMKQQAREQAKQQKQQEREQKTKTSIIMKLLYKVEDVPEIADKANCSEAYVKTIASNKKIYTKSRVIKEIKSGKSNEEIAKEGKVDTKAVQAVREEYNRKKQEGEKDRELRRLYAEGKSAKEIMEVLPYKSASTISTRKKNIGAYSRKEIIALLDTKSDAEIASDARLDKEIIAKIRQEENERREKAKTDKILKQQAREQAKQQRQQEKQQRQQAREQAKQQGQQEKQQRQQEKDRELRLLYAEGKSIKKIMENLHYKNAVSVSKRKKNIGAYSRKEIIALLDTKSDAEIAADARLDKEIIAKIRQEENERKEKADKILKNKKKNKKERKQKQQRQQERGQAKQEQKKSQVRTIEPKEPESPIVHKPTTQKVDIIDDDLYISTEFLRAAEDFESIQTIIGKTGFDEDGVEVRYLKTGIYTREQVIQLIREGKMTDAEIATQGHGNERAVSEIRKTIKKLDSLKPEVREQVEAQLKSGYISPMEIVRKLHGTVSIFVVKELRDGMRKSTKTKEQRYNSAMNSLRRQKVNGEKQTSNCRALTKRIDREKICTILVLYSEFLTELDYAYIAFRYLTMGDIFKAINIGEQFLGLDDLTEEGIRKKIFEVVEKSKTAQKAGIDASRLTGDER